MDICYIGVKGEFFPILTAPAPFSSIFYEKSNDRSLKQMADESGNLLLNFCTEIEFPTATFKC